MTKKLKSVSIKNTFLEILPKKFYDGLWHRVMFKCDGFYLDDVFYEDKPLYFKMDVRAKLPRKPRKRKK